MGTTKNVKYNSVIPLQNDATTIYKRNYVNKVNAKNLYTEIGGKKVLKSSIKKRDDSLQEVSRKDIEKANRNDKILEAIGWQDKAGKPSITQGLAKTVGASALMATGAKFSSPVVNTIGGLAKNIIAGSLGAEGFAMLEGRTATPTELAVGAGMEMGVPLALKGVSSVYGKMFKSKATTPVVENKVQEVAPVAKKESIYQSLVPFKIEKPTINTLQLKSTMIGSPLEKQLSKDGMLSINSLQAHLNNQSTSVADRTMIQKVIDEKFAGQSKINYNDLRKAVSDEMVPLEKNFDSEYSNYGVGALGYPGVKKESIEKAIENGKEHLSTFYNNRHLYDNYDNVKSTVKQIRENKKLLSEIPKENTSIVYSNKDKFGYGSTDHFKNEGTLGHSRILVSKEEPDVLHILEQQSDYYQKDQYSKLLANKKEAIDGGYDQSIIQSWTKKVEDYEKKQINPIQKALLGKTHQDRLLQENVAHAAQNGQTKMRYPTPETAAKIQGYKKENFSDVDPLLETQHKEKVKVLWDEVNKHGDPYELYDQGHPAAIAWNDELEKWQKYLQSIKKEGYRPEHQTILKKYNDNPKMVKKILGAETRTVTDAKGNTWFEFDIPEAFRKGKAEIKALSTIGAVAGYKSIVDKNQKK